MSALSDVRRQSRSQLKGILAVVHLIVKERVDLLNVSSCLRLPRDLLRGEAEQLVLVSIVHYPVEDQKEGYSDVIQQIKI